MKNVIAIILAFVICLASVTLFFFLRKDESVEYDKEETVSQKEVSKNQTQTTSKEESLVCITGTDITQIDNLLSNRTNINISDDYVKSEMYPDTTVTRNIKLRNVGDNGAFVRVHVAIPCDWDYNVCKKKFIILDKEQYDNEWSWKDKDGKYISYITTINNVDYVVYVITYNGMIGTDSTTYHSLTLNYYFDKCIICEAYENGFYYMDENENKVYNDFDLPIYVESTVSTTSETSSNTLNKVFNNPLTEGYAPFFADKKQVSATMLVKQRIEQSDDNTSPKNLEDFKSDLVFPAVGPVSWAEEMQQWPTGGASRLFSDELGNVHDRFVFIKNNGEKPIYYRTIIAIEDPANTYTKDKLISININGYKTIDWNQSKEGIQSVEDVEIIENVIIDGVCHYVVVATYTEKLEKNQVSRPSLLQFYLQSKTTNEDYANFGDEITMPILTQAVQADGWTGVESSISAQDALNKTFGKITAKNHPWSN